MLTRLVESLHRINVSTLDSFFHRITRTFALELDIPPDPVLLDDRSPQARDLRLQAIEALLSEAAGGMDEADQLPTLIALLREVHHDQLKRSVTQSIDGVVADLYDIYRDTDDSVLWSQLHVPGLLDDDELAAAIARLEAMEPALPTTKAGKVRASWAKSFANALNQAIRGDWEAFLGSGVPAKLAGGETTFDRVPMSEEWIQAYQPLVEHARDADRSPQASD